MSNIKIYPTFPQAFDAISERMQHQAHDVHPDEWQGIDVKAKPEAAMKEICFVCFQVPIGPSPDLGRLADAVRPNLPWADNHFEQERVSRHPKNPGETWRDWPWGNSASNFVHGTRFDHTYAERYWPKFAGLTEDGILNSQNSDDCPRFGIRFEYGDLDDVVDLLEGSPLTRQAYLPVFFPEDTGANGGGGRIPCSIGYHFMMRGGALHCVYQLRSCDFYRHFRDDVYLSVRLQLWVLDELRRRDPKGWNHVQPGLFTMIISSLHMFVNDYRRLFRV